jgi:glutamyl-Q tRNA(Asp) synthetase
MAQIGRFAPTPSGPLHFGSLVAAVASYCQARAQQGQWLMRIEDVDTPRVVKGSADQILADLEAFGFEWDGEVLYQSSQFERYRHYLEILLHQGECYACECSRRHLREQAVKSGPLGQIYPGFCRHKELAREGHSIRLNTENAGLIEFTDQVYGRCELNLPGLVGDFVLKRVDNIYAYHLAVVVDDYLQNVDEIVRGADLLENTCLHIYLQRLLGFPQAEYMHVPLVNNDRGVKLSKQTGATALDYENASTLLVEALEHLGQNPHLDLDQLRPTEILRWATDHWHSDKINGNT